MNCTGKDAAIKQEESLSCKGRLWAFCLAQPGAMKGMRLYLYITQAASTKDGEELFRSMHNVVPRENGCKTAISKVKVEVRRSELWEWADPADVCPWQQKERKGDAGVPSSVRLQHCKDLRRRISAARMKQDFLCNWLKKIRVCAMFCTKPVQQILTLTWQHSWRCSSPRQTHWYMQKEQRDDAPTSAGWKCPYRSPNTAERNNSKISTTSPRRNLGKKGVNKPNSLPNSNINLKNMQCCRGWSDALHSQERSNNTFIDIRQWINKVQRKMTNVWVGWFAANHHTTCYLLLW